MKTPMQREKPLKVPKHKFRILDFYEHSGGVHEYVGNSSEMFIG